MTNTECKLSGALRFILPLLTLLIICAVSFGIPVHANELPCENHVNANGTCENCGEALLLEYSNNGSISYFTDFATAVSYARQNSGTLKMLRDINANGVGISYGKQNFTFNFNGFTLSDSYFIGSDITCTGTLTLEDSDAKTGKLIQGDTPNQMHAGSVTVNGLTMTAGVTVWNGIIEFNGTKFTDAAECFFESKAETGVPGYLSFENVTCNTVANFSSEDSAFGSEFMLRNSFFKQINITPPNGVGALLDTGYAFFDEFGKPINGSVSTAYNVTVGEHLHNYNTTLFDSENHWLGCGCGAAAPTATPTPHSFVDCNADCENCEYVKPDVTHTYTNACDTECNVCGATRVTEHQWNDATCTEPKTCSVCGVTEGKANGHSYDNACDTDCNVCGATRKTNHSYDNACDDTCNSCGSHRVITHSFNKDGKCTVCGVGDENENSNAGAVVAVTTVAAGSATAIGGVALILRNLIRKKKEDEE